MNSSNFAVFTPEMKKDYTILVPTMLPMHFKIMEAILNSYGYKAVLLENTGSSVKDCGLKYVHNDTCYPALLVIGQLIDAIQSGKYDPHKVALLISQTGGGCRASNYISLLRKALQKAGYEYIPVLSFNISGLESQPGFKITVPMLHRMLYAVLYGDLLMLLRNQCRPYEIRTGEAQALADKWTKRLTDEMASSRVKYSKVKANYRAILDDFARIPMRREDKVKVGIVGEIFVKFSPLGKQKDLIDIIEQHGVFRGPTPFEHTISLTKGYIGIGAKMGEGWLLTAEMLELIDEGVENIVCTQPFGCLPNHIVGKGMMKPIKERHPGVNIVAVDYDPGATKINQENRIKLMLANASAATVSA